MLVERLLRVVEEAHVPDRDRGLCGERLDERDLLRREPAGLDALDADDPDGVALEQDRHRESRTVMVQLFLGPVLSASLGPDQEPCLLGAGVGDLERATLVEGEPDEGCLPGR